MCVPSLLLISQQFTCYSADKQTRLNALPTLAAMPSWVIIIITRRWTSTPQRRRGCLGHLILELMCELEDCNNSYRELTLESVSERILKIGPHLPKLIKSQVYCFLKLIMYIALMLTSTYIPRAKAMTEAKVERLRPRSRILALRTNTINTTSV